MIPLRWEGRCEKIGRASLLASRDSRNLSANEARREPRPPPFQPVLNFFTPSGVDGWVVPDGDPALKAEAFFSLPRGDFDGGVKKLIAARFCQLQFTEFRHENR